MCFDKNKHQPFSAFLRAAWLAAACLTFGSLHAQSIESARTAFDEGDFLGAAEMTARLDTSSGYALAAEALAIYGFHLAGEEERAEIFATATEYAEKAVELDAENVEAHLQLAHAMGRYAQTMSVLEIFGDGYVGRVRDASETAARLAPESAIAHLGIASWHAQALHEGGIAARLAFGASRSRALEHIDLALRYGTDQTIVQLEAGNALLLLSERRYGERARQLLINARDMPVRDAHEALLRQRALLLLADLDDG